jgi:drug/metabolite transporter (DMT)-like permease
MPHTRSAPAWAIILGFTLIYLTWGTTYLATSIGVREERLPPLLFGGTRITLAGGILLAWQLLRGASVRVAMHELPAIFGTSILMFLCGNGLVNVGQQTVNSGVAAVLVATTPLWIGLFAMLFPHGDRLTLRGWLGLFVGLAGVVVLLSPKLKEPTDLVADLGWMCVLGSSISWALGSLLTRQFKPKADHLTGAAYHLICGGLALTLVGLAIGERLPYPEDITGRAVAAYMYLLIVGSLMGFVAFNWLLGHVSAAKVGTYAYVNPIVAVFVGWAAGEAMSAALIGGIAVILAGVFLVRGGERPCEAVAPAEEPMPTPVAAAVEVGEGQPG